MLWVTPMPAFSELLCTDVDSLAVARDVGADRVEVCAALEVGGVTPGPGLVREAVRIRDAAADDDGRPAFEVVVLTRPRRGDFVYGEADFAALMGDVEAAREAGADGVALGVLFASGAVDLDRTRALVEAARPMKVTFHRAVDHARDLLEAGTSLVEMGVDRLLTSGGAASAWRGREMLRSLAQALEGRIEVVAAGRVHGGNAAELLRETGVPAIHGSCAKVVRTPGVSVPLGTSGSRSETERATLDPASARAFVAAAREAP